MVMDKEIAISVLNELIVELEKPEFQKGLKAGLQKVRDDDVKEKKKNKTEDMRECSSSHCGRIWIRIDTSGR